MTRDEEHLLKRKIRGYVNEITHHKICGNDMPFPFCNRVSHPTLFERILEKDALKEGLIRTYPLKWVEKWIAKRINSDFVTADVNYDESYLWCILKKDSPSIEKLKSQMEKFGYYCSVESNVKEGVYLQFEMKYDEFLFGNNFPGWNDGDYVVFHHVTPICYLVKIMEQGLVPKSKNDWLKYPDRVYLTMARENSYRDMAEMLYDKNANPRVNENYALLGISLKGLGNTKFYPDRNVSDFTAFYTYDNIPPQNLKFLKLFNVVD